MQAYYLRLIFVGNDLVEVDTIKAESSEEAGKYYPYPFGNIAKKSPLITMKVVQVSKVIEFAGVFDSEKSVE